ncbi:MAG: A/G-specific adenine glycosylase [Lysobacteraceae bacterium]
MKRVDPHPIASRLLKWFDQHGRHDLPWQHPRSAYRVWISETMLQQTQVAVVIPYFRKFIATLPDIASLATAPLDNVFALWSGLGYYSRARRLQETALICVRDHAGKLPRDFGALLALPGIGRSTAGAVLALAHDLPYPILDGNVRRVLCRHRAVHGWPGSAATQKILWNIAEHEVPASRIADYTQALMDLGATVCTSSKPACATCPLRADCVALRAGSVDRLPERKPSKSLPEREVHALVVRDREGRILLQRRPPVGVWASLWSLPEAQTIDEARNWLTHHADADAFETLPTIRHTFSHFRLHIHPLLWRDARCRNAIGDNDGLRWQAADRLIEIALPAPMRKLLEELS